MKWQVESDYWKIFCNEHAFSIIVICLKRLELAIILINEKHKIKQQVFFVEFNDSSYFLNIVMYIQPTGCPNKHGNSVTNLISSLLWNSIVIPKFKSHNSNMSARVYLMKSVKDCKDVSIMSRQDEQCRRTSLLCLCTVIFLFY